MQIEITSQGFSMTPGLRNYTLQRLRAPRAVLAARVHRISVRLSDENGPRGGIDKRCQIAIHLSGRPPVVVEHTQDDLYRAIDHVVKRALNSVLRHLSRRRGRGAKAMHPAALAPHDEPMPDRSAVAADTGAR
ncbi:HPF/RaiA family ribosome-associated protein [Denitromonas iodatirespirans]|uniref:HPF/RaiA family ribosome-associated protein n=1 Tax=Denitromonas iodatirespirans TaxID=2795389 RepID=A0A944DCH4_DENI1|nr:HPF/RaiA family ribosome-associated protein [Denitromonas iodatirespirans]MBT0963710.1 HPF/RaiA family ribosome-associated protein [Denitromonas iodatirespirans]